MSILRSFVSDTDGNKSTSMIKKLLFKICIIFLFSLSFMSCNSTKKIKYFQDIPDSGALKIIKKAEYVEPTIQFDDILVIQIQTINAQSSSMVSIPATPITPSLSSSVTAQQSGFLVDKDGFVEIPVLGKIKLVGLTTTQARELIKLTASKYFKDPTVILKYANFTVTVTGEVTKPGEYLMQSEKVSIIDALAMAGDLTIFAKRENVLLVRENADGTKTPYRINLKKSDVLSSPYYYLRQNDFIYVEPRKAKSDATDASQQKYITLAGSVISVLLVLLYRTK